MPADDPDHQPGREQAAEGNAGFHRAGRPLVRADAQRAAAAAGRADQARREDRQPPAGGKIANRRRSAGACDGVGKSYPRLPAAPASNTILLDDHRFRALLPDDDWGRLPLAIRRRFCKRLAGGATVVYVGEVDGDPLEPRRLVARATGAPDRRAAADRAPRPASR